MLHDLFYVTLYFGDIEGVSDTRRLIRTYGADQVYTALALGLLQRRVFECGNGKRRDYCWLTQKAKKRLKAA